MVFLGKRHRWWAVKTPRITCSSCSVPKPHTLANFKPSKNCRNGLTKTCRRCSGDYLKGWRAKHRKRLGARRAELYAQAEKVIEARRERRRWHDDPIRKRAQIMRGSVQQHVFDLGLRRSPELKSIKWFADRLRASPFCPCCGVLFDVQGAHARGGAGPSNASPSVDRLVPRLGYTVKNVTIICWRCNNLKRDATPAELECVAAWARKETTRRGIKWDA